MPCNPFRRKKSVAPKQQSKVSDDTFVDNGRTLHVYVESWKQRQATIFDDDKETVLYNIDIRNRRPNLTFRNGNDVQVGTIAFNPWNRAITANIQNTDISVKSKNWKTCNLLYTSKAFGGQQLEWQRQTPWVVLDHFLVDEHKMPIAKISPREWAKKKYAVIELVDPNLPQEAIDEVVMIGLAVFQNTKYYTAVNAGSS
ncbi:hypothetical protein PV10_08576 [Exophiala mesophila]|uniref:Uncharacterized protein n=1 Tax=Exophiala mesophila TaxID=212818 RepID=A0A0D1XL98_EXOME|nr:uncharacterized protein PV10_08576 [Exophiala mesophila]KIV88951.1 hypothetical protein PV10_08576 [Exophiala mesophila]